MWRIRQIEKLINAFLNASIQYAFLIFLLGSEQLQKERI